MKLKSGKIFFIYVLLLIIPNITSGQNAGNSIMLDGINDFLRVPHNSSLNPGTGSWSISMWIKPVDEVRRSPLVTKRMQSGGYDQYSLGFAGNDPHNPVPGKKIYYNYIDESGISERSGISNEDHLDSSWHHIVIIADKSRDSIFLYKDGIKQNYNLMYKYGPWPDINNTVPLFIGYNNMSHYYKGQMDELCLWNKALTIDQIILIKSDTLRMNYYITPDSGLAGYWRFDQYEDLGIGNPGNNDIRDFSYWHNHGDAEGNPVLILSGVPIGIKIINDIIPAEYNLHQNYPNPFNPVTKIRFDIPAPSPLERAGVRLIIYDILGREVASLIPPLWGGQEGLKPGTYEAEWDASDFPSGIYFYRLETDKFIETKKAVLIK